MDGWHKAGHDIFTLLGGPLEEHTPAVLIAGVFAQPASPTTTEWAAFISIDTPMGPSPITTTGQL
jgi:hypothetical protein